MLRYVIAIACVVGVSAKCAKSCQKYDCDYWVDELMMDCKSLEKEYQCDCGGCHCKPPETDKKYESKSKLVKPSKKTETGVCPVSVWKFPVDGFFTYGKSFLSGNAPTKADLVLFPESSKPYEVELPPKTNADVGMIVLKPGAWLIVGEGSVLTSHEPQGCTLSDCSEDKNAAGQKGYDVINDKAVSCKSKDKPVAPKPTTKKPTTSPKDCVDYDGDDLCGDKDKCPFSTDNDSDGDDLCELHCTPTPKEMLNRIEAEKKDREIDSRDSGNNRYEDNRPKSLFQKEFVGKWYTCLRTDPCPQDPDNKCKKDDEKPTKPAVTSKPGKCLDFDDDGVCNKDDKCVFSADNDNDKDDLCEIHCEKQPDGYESKQKN